MQPHGPNANHGSAFLMGGNGLLIGSFSQIICKSATLKVTAMMKAHAVMWPTSQQVGRTINTRNWRYHCCECGC